MAVSKKLTKESFRKWLGNYTAKTKVGFRDGKTPIERYMESIEITHSDLPLWAQKYNDAVRSHKSASICSNAANQLLDTIR